MLFRLAQSKHRKNCKLATTRQIGGMSVQAQIILLEEICKNMPQKQIIDVGGSIDLFADSRKAIIIESHANKPFVKAAKKD